MSALPIICESAATAGCADMHAVGDDGGRIIELTFWTGSDRQHLLSQGCRFSFAT